MRPPRESTPAALGALAEDADPLLADLQRRRTVAVDVIAEGLLELLLRERATHGTQPTREQTDV